MTNIARTSSFLRHRLWRMGCLAATALTAMVMLSCSNISEEERFIYVKPADVNRKVLIEDFTGQRCVNCPAATLEIEKIQEQYGHDNVIAVGIHSGPLGFKGSATLIGLATDLGDEYYNYWTIGYQPLGMVNRTGKQDYQQWASKVSEYIRQTSSMQLSLTANYDSQSHEATIQVETLGTNGSTTGRLQLWVVEDSITAMQLRYNEVDKPTSGQLSDRDYVHNHVLRTAVNGTWGDDFTLGEGESKSLTYHFTPDPSWRPEQLSVVAFVYNDNGVVQVEKTNIHQ